MSSVGRYAVILLFQTILMLVDLIINTFGIFLRTSSIVMLILFIVQDVCLILALAALFVSFIDTHVFRSGFVVILYERFRLTIIVSVMYLILTSILYIWILVVQWSSPTYYTWSVGIHIFYVLQKLMSPVYYYFYKRAALRISDPRFYEDITLEPKISETAQSIKE